MIESAVVLSVLLLLLLGMLELSLAITRNTVMSEVARRVARMAIVHGANASAAQGHWGIAELKLTAADNHPAAAAARDVLLTLPPADVKISLTWPDADNEPDDRIHVTATYTHTPLVPIPGWYGQLNLRSESTMRIAH